MLNNEEINAEVQHSQKEGKEDVDEDEINSQLKTIDKDAFECFSKGLACLKQTRTMGFL